jgi:leucine dehydrogenase
MHNTPSVFDAIAQHGHEQVVFCQDEATGLKAIIGIHNTVLGPSLGGVRMWPYASEAEALKDVLRLSRGMTYKNAIAGLNLGGGKAVIIGDSRTQKTEALMRAFGKFVENLNGKYITAEDVGMTDQDMEYISMETEHVGGMPVYRGGLGAPSEHTAYGTYMGMKAAAKIAYGSDSLSGKSVAVQGVGNVAEFLIEYLHKENCRMVVCDIYQDRLDAIAKKYPVEVVAPEAIYDQPVDIYAPCALGATINDDTLARLQCRIIAGCANNQLADEQKHGQACLEKGILYAPDFLVNSGGVINVYAEVIGTNTDWTHAQVEKIYDQTLKVLTRSEQEKRNAQEVAIELAQSRIDLLGKVQSHY